MKKENIRAFVEYQFKALDGERASACVLLIFILCGLSVAFSVSATKSYITAVNLIIAIGFSVYSFKVLDKNNGNMSIKFIYDSICAVCVSSYFVIMACLTTFEDGGNGNWVQLLLILMVLSILSIILVCFVIKQNMKKGVYKQTPAQVGSYAGIGATLGWVFSRTFSQDLNAYLLMITGCAALLVMIFSAYAAVQFYRYYLTKKYELE